MSAGTVAWVQHQSWRSDGPSIAVNTSTTATSISIDRPTKGPLPEELRILSQMQTSAAADDSTIGAF